jgi:hypothetical protein
MKKLLIITALLILSASITNLSKMKFVFPSGWKPTEKADFTKDAISYWKNVVPNRVDGDFNGDGFSDTAWFLINDTKEKYRLSVYLGDKNGGSKTIILIEDSYKRTDSYNLGIGLMELGNYKTACGKGYWDCAPGEPAVLTLKNPGIDFFEFECCDSVFYWDAQKKEFKQVSISD